MGNPVAATHILSLSEVDPATIPDGAYSGSWNGWRVAFDVGSMLYRARTSTAIAQAADCTVTINGGKVTVELTKKGDMA